MAGILTQASRQVFSLRAPTQPVKPMVKVISPGRKRESLGYRVTALIALVFCCWSKRTNKTDHTKGRTLSKTNDIIIRTKHKYFLTAILILYFLNL